MKFRMIVHSDLFRFLYRWIVIFSTPNPRPHASINHADSTHYYNSWGCLLMQQGFVVQVWHYQYPLDRSLSLFARLVDGKSLSIELLKHSERTLSLFAKPVKGKSLSIEYLSLPERSLPLFTKLVSGKSLSIKLLNPGRSLSLQARLLYGNYGSNQLGPLVAVYLTPCYCRQCALFPSARDWWTEFRCQENFLLVTYRAVYGDQSALFAVKQGWWMANHCPLCFCDEGIGHEWTIRWGCILAPEVYGLDWAGYLLFYFQYFGD